jgi:hypothetical protein
MSNQKKIHQNKIHQNRIHPNKIHQNRIHQNKILKTKSTKIKSSKKKPQNFQKKNSARMVGMEIMLKVTYKSEILHDYDFKGMLATVNVESKPSWTDTPVASYGEECLPKLLSWSRSLVGRYIRR